MYNTPFTTFCMNPNDSRSYFDIPLFLAIHSLHLHQSHKNCHYPSHCWHRWSSRCAFYFAAIGSAVGFGNVWRFPSLVYEYGGGAFFIPYVLALVLIGMPLLVLEISLGQYYQTGGESCCHCCWLLVVEMIAETYLYRHIRPVSDVNVFGSIRRRLHGIGLSSVACGYMLVIYYSMLMAWFINDFFDSFGSNFWAQVRSVQINRSAFWKSNLACRMDNSINRALTLFLILNLNATTCVGWSYWNRGKILFLQWDYWYEYLMRG